MTMDIVRFKQALFSRSLTRRQFKEALASVGLAATFAPMSGKARAQDADHPTFYLWAGYEVPEMLPAYIEKYGRAPDYSLWGDEEEALAKMTAGFKPDLTMPCSYKVQKWYDAGFLGAIDTAKLSNWNDIFESLRTMKETTMNGETVWVPIDWGQTSVLYRTDLAPEYVGNETWNILWDPKYAGRMSLFDSLIDGVAVAGIVLGIDPFNMNDEQIELVRAKLKEQLPLLRFYSNDMASVEQALASGELVAATTWNASLVNLKKEGLPVAFMNPKEGAMTWVCGLSVIKGTERMDKVYEVIDAVLDPRSRAWEIEAFGYGSATKGGFDGVSDEVLASLGLPRDPGPLLASGIFQAPMANESAVQTMFEEVKAGV
ncbi:MAG: extracellular solute-binding protein [Alphaproteobacteria bacterium]|nr:extracellular solute-binding protein [Alphaproteobacteria bacterium]